MRLRQLIDARKTRVPRIAVWFGFVLGCLLLSPLTDADAQPSGATSANEPVSPASSPRVDRSDDTTEEDASTEDERASGWAIEQGRFRLTFFDQHGEGFQSLDGPAGGPGSERALIVQPQFWARIRQNERLVHDVAVPIDIISSASVDAIDAVSSASRVNEAFGLEVASRYAATDDGELTVRAGGHVEEQMRSFSTGAAWTQNLAQRNAVLVVSGNAIADFIRNYTPNGEKNGSIARQALNANVSLSQLLSPTTVIYGTYGLTLQIGDLETPWNTVPMPNAEEPVKERLPSNRVRHAWTIRLAQYAPLTRTALGAYYRYYRDTFDISAHTWELTMRQYLGSMFYVRGNVRFHRQSGVSFFYESTPPDLAPDADRTSDSDLARFDSTEWGAQIVWMLDPDGEVDADAPYLDIAYSQYVRTNDFRAHILSMGLASRF